MVDFQELISDVNASVSRINPLVRIYEKYRDDRPRLLALDGSFIGMNKKKYRESVCLGSWTGFWLYYEFPRFFGYYPTVQELGKHIIELSSRMVDEQQRLAASRSALQQEQKSLESGIYQFPRDALDLKAAIASRLRTFAKREVKVTSCFWRKRYPASSTICERKANCSRTGTRCLEIAHQPCGDWHQYHRCAQKSS